MQDGGGEHVVDPPDLLLVLMLLQSLEQVLVDLPQDQVAALGGLQHVLHGAVQVEAEGSVAVHDGGPEVGQHIALHAHHVHIVVLQQGEEHVVVMEGLGWRHLDVHNGLRVDLKQLQLGLLVEFDDLYESFLISHYQQSCIGYLVVLLRLHGMAELHGNDPALHARDLLAFILALCLPEVVEGEIRSQLPLPLDQRIDEEIPALVASNKVTADPFQIALHLHIADGRRMLDGLLDPILLLDPLDGLGELCCEGEFGLRAGRLHLWHHLARSVQFIYRFPNYLYLQRGQLFDISELTQNSSQLALQPFLPSIQPDLPCSTRALIRSSSRVSQWKSLSAMARAYFFLTCSSGVSSSESYCSNLSELLFCTWMLCLVSTKMTRSLKITSMVWLDSRNTAAELVRQYWLTVVSFRLCVPCAWGCLNFFMDLEQASKMNSFFLISLSSDIFSQTNLLTARFSVVQVTVFFRLFSKYISEPSLNTKQIRPVLIWQPYPNVSLMSANSVMQLLVSVMLLSDGLMYFEDLKFFRGKLPSLWLLALSSSLSTEYMGSSLAVWMLSTLLLMGTFSCSPSWNFTQYYEMYWFDGGQENIVFGKICGSEGYFLNMLCSRIRGNFSLSSGFLFRSLLTSWAISGLGSRLQASSPLVRMNGLAPSISSQMKTPMFQELTSSALMGSLAFRSSGATQPFLSSWRRAMDLGQLSAETQMEKGTRSFMLGVRQISSMSINWQNRPLDFRQLSSSMRSIKKQMSSNSVRPSLFSTRSDSRQRSAPEMMNMISALSSVVLQMGQTTRLLMLWYSFKFSLMTSLMLFSCSRLLESTVTSKSSPERGSQKRALQPNRLNLLILQKCSSTPSCFIRVFLSLLSMQFLLQSQ